MKPSVLIVEDNEMMCVFLESYLGEKYHITVKNNGVEALKWLEEGNIPSLIISDLNMPDLNGMEMLKAIRASNFHKKIPFMVLSSKEKSQDRIQCLKMGANDYITKPFNPEELELKITQTLSIHA